MKTKALRGIFLLVAAEFCFAIATVFAKYATTNTNIPALEATFLRFFLGFIVTSAYVFKSGISLKPNNTKLVIARAVLNTGAVVFFFLSVKYTTITNANMLNMTYPVFIFLFAPLLIKEKITKKQLAFLVLTMIGIGLIVHPDFHTTNIGDFYGLLSGIIGALAIITLRKARECDSTTIIIFYLMAIGMVLNGIMLIPVFVMPTNMQLLQLSISGLLGFAGQSFLTAGYKYMKAGEGSLVSASRIVFAFFLGSLLFAESITLGLIFGALLIVISLLGISLEQLKKEKGI